MGRGLGALISSTGPQKKPAAETVPSTNTGERVLYIPVSQITADPKQPRRNFKQEELQELADSIKEHGVLQPLLASEMPDGRYQIIAGERRWRASQLANMPTVPVIVKKMADDKRLEVALIENIQREDLNALEEAFAFKRLIDEFGLTQEQVAQKVGKSRPAVANTIRLLALPEEIQAALISGKISPGQARALLSLTDKKQQMDMFQSMLGQKITVRDLEKQVQQQVPKSSLRRDPNLMYLEEQLRATLGTKVSVSGKQDKGSITVSYYSKDELKEIIKKITGV